MGRRFCGGDGVILKLVAAPGSRDRYVDVEWISDFYEEKERLFMFAANMRITDIHYFRGDDLLQNGQYLRAFLLFSSLFQGHFVFPLLRRKSAKKLQRPSKLLVDLITIYKATNGITETMDNALKIRIPLYVQQLFYQLLDGFKRNNEMKYVIESEIDLLDESLKRELMMIPSSVSDNEEHHQLTLSPFMQTLCSVDGIALMEKFIWIIDGMQLNRLQSFKFEVPFYSNTHHFIMPDVGEVSFVFVLRRKSAGSTSVGIGIKIKKTAVPVDGRWSVMVEEVGYNRNDIRMRRIGDGDYRGVIAFDDHLVEEVDVLTLAIALHFTASC